MEPGNGNGRNRRRWGWCSSSKAGRSLRSLLHLKPPFFRRTKVIPGKDTEGNEDTAPASTLTCVQTIDKKNKQPVVADEGSKSVCERPSSSNPEVKIEDQTDSKFQCFKRFDSVTDCSGHHYAKHVVKKPSKYCLKRIQYEWNILEKNLPETIFVRVYEDRMDLLRAVIIGAAGTPYHDGLFFFDIHFQEDYPMSPPKVHYHSLGVSLNPNLYRCGKVCLSLLNTWFGGKHERWDPQMSTILQVLVSIQGLVLNKDPYFNEPTNVVDPDTKFGKDKSMYYNRRVFLLSRSVILKILRNPPKHFEDFVAGHFLKQRLAILTACNAYMGGAHIGSVRADGEINAGGKKESSLIFYDTLAGFIRNFHKILNEITAEGARCSGPSPDVKSFTS